MKTLTRALYATLAALLAVALFPQTAQAQDDSPPGYYRHPGLEYPDLGSVPLAAPLGLYPYAETHRILDHTVRFFCRDKGHGLRDADDVPTYDYKVSIHRGIATTHWKDGWQVIPGGNHIRVNEVWCLVPDIIERFETPHLDGHRLGVPDYLADETRTAQMIVHAARFFCRDQGFDHVGGFETSKAVEADYIWWKNGWQRAPLVLRGTSIDNLVCTMVSE